MLTACKLEVFLKKCFRHRSLKHFFKKHFQLTCRKFFLSKKHPSPETITVFFEKNVSNIDAISGFFFLQKNVSSIEDVKIHYDP